MSEEFILKNIILPRIKSLGKKIAELHKIRSLTLKTLKAYDKRLKKLESFRKYIYAGGEQRQRKFREDILKTLKEGLRKKAKKKKKRI